MLGIHRLRELAEANGVRLEVVPAERIADLQEEIRVFAEEHPCNGFQKWIVQKHYSFKIPTSSLSVLIVAVPHPAYADVIFQHNGREYAMYGLIAPPVEKVKKAIVKAVRAAGHQIHTHSRLPLKRLAVQAGLAEYGRNNITYVPGFGSHVSYIAFSTDVLCGVDPWREVCMAESCLHCSLCAENCPTGAIPEETFPIDSTKCLSFLNESPGEFPPWLPSSAHHTPFDCLRCQTVCPMNTSIPKLEEPVCFSEEDTKRILAGAPYQDAPKELRHKIALLSLDKWPDAIPRNLKTLFALMDAGHKPSLS